MAERAYHEKRITEAMSLLTDNEIKELDEMLNGKVPHEVCPCCAMPGLDLGKECPRCHYER